MITGARPDGLDDIFKPLLEDCVTGPPVIHVEHLVAFGDGRTAERQTGTIRGENHIDLINGDQSTDEAGDLFLGGFTVVVFVSERNFFAVHTHSAIRWY